MADKFRWFLLFENNQDFRDQFIEGEVRKMYVNEQFICIAKYNDHCYAFEDKCPHQGKTLLGATCNKSGMLTCPHHQYKFNIETGQGHGMYINKYEIKEENSQIFVGFKRGYFDFL